MRASLLAAALLVAFGGCFGASDGDGGATSSNGPTSTSPTETTGAHQHPGSSTSGPAPSSSTSTRADGNTPPTANLTAATLQGPAPLSVTFTINGTDADGDALTYNLTFSDGTASEVGDLTVIKETAHTFAAAGTYVVVLNVSDGTTFALDTKTITVDSAAGSQTYHADWMFANNWPCAMAGDWDMFPGSDGINYDSEPAVAATWGQPFTVTFASGALEDHLLFVAQDGAILLDLEVGGLGGSWSGSGTVPAGTVTLVFYGCFGTPGESADYEAGLGVA